MTPLPVQHLKQVDSKREKTDWSNMFKENIIIFFVIVNGPVGHSESSSVQRRSPNSINQILNSIFQSPGLVPVDSSMV